MPVFDIEGMAWNAVDMIAMGVDFIPHQKNLLGYCILLAKTESEEVGCFLEMQKAVMVKVALYCGKPCVFCDCLNKIKQFENILAFGADILESMKQG